MRGEDRRGRRFGEAERLRHREGGGDRGVALVPRARGDQLGQQRGDGEVLDVLRADTEGVDPRAHLRLEMLRIAVEEGGLDVGERGAVVDETVDGLAVADGAHDLLEEVVFAADDVDVGMLERLADELGVGLRDVLLHADLGELDVAILGEAELELLVLLAGDMEELHRGGLQLDGLRLGVAAGLDAGGGGEFAILDAGGLGLGLGLGDLGVPMRFCQLTLEEMNEALNRGWGELDSRAPMRLQLERAGVRIQCDPAAIQAVLERDG